MAQLDKVKVKPTRVWTDEQGYTHVVEEESSDQKQQDVEMQP